MTTATTNASPIETTVAAAKKPMAPWVKNSIWATAGVALAAAVGFGVKIYLGRNSGN